MLKFMYNEIRYIYMGNIVMFDFIIDNVRFVYSAIMSLADGLFSAYAHPLPVTIDCSDYDELC